MEPEDLTAIMLARAGVTVSEVESARAAQILARPRQQKDPRLTSEPVMVHIPKAWDA